MAALTLLKIVPAWLWAVLLAAALAVAGVERTHLALVQMELAHANTALAQEKQARLADAAAAVKAAQDQRDAQTARAQAAADAFEKAQTQWATTLKATRHDLYVSTENLASCHVSVDSVRLLNDAADGGAPQK